MKARVKWVEGVRFVGESGSGHAVIVEGSPEHGGRDLGPRPMELVLLGMASCSAFDVVEILRKARQPVTDCVVEAEGERAGTVPKVFTKIHVTYRVAGRGLDARQVTRAAALSNDKYCSATRMLAKTADITFDVVVIDGDRVPANVGEESAGEASAG